MKTTSLRARLAAACAAAAIGLTAFVVPASAQFDPNPEEEIDRPDTYINEYPSGATSPSSGFVSFSSSTGGATFSCALDSFSGNGCESPFNFGGLSDGYHYLVVWSTYADKTDDTPAIAEWIVDGTAPETSIESTQPELTTQTSMTLFFSSNEIDASFTCVLDAAPAIPCGSGHTFEGLADGAHVVEIAAYDGAGNVDASPAVASWVVDTLTPQTFITEGTFGLVASHEATFVFSSDDPEAEILCAVDRDEPAPCVSPITVHVEDGDHVFRAMARDRAGNLDLDPAKAGWSSDTVAPETVIDEVPAAVIDVDAAQVVFHASESIVSFTCAFDGGAETPCGGTVSLTGLTEGAHAVVIRATDAAGNVESTPETVAWTVDLPDPTPEPTPAPTPAEIACDAIEDIAVSGVRISCAARDDGSLDVSVSRRGLKVRLHADADEITRAARDVRAAANRLRRLFR